MFRSGFIALIGRPNVGKSTLMNALVGEKMAIISEKPQTTRNQIRGILTTDTYQMIFLDTPGIHKPHHKLGAKMVQVSLRTLSEVDLILFLVDAAAGPGTGDEYIIKQLQAVKTPVILVINKSDRSGMQQAEKLLAHYRVLYPFAGEVVISALTGINKEKLLSLMLEHLEEGPQYYPAEMITDQPERLIVAELIREKILQLTHDEVPHAVAVEIVSMSARPGRNLVDIQANIYVERESQKGIVIGKKGLLLKEIGQMARHDIESLLGSAANLAGINLVSSCGGDGTCGRCLVKVQDGHVRVSESGNLSARAKQAGLVLACQAFADSNVVVNIPSMSRLAEHQVLLDENQLMEEDIETEEGFSFLPLCRTIELTLSPPNLAENVADWERLQIALRSAMNCSDIRISLPVLSQLPEVLRSDDWRVTVIVTQINDCAEVVDIAAGHVQKNLKNYGLAIDIGTTTVAVSLIDLVSGLPVGNKGTYNRQASFGDDVISRIIHASEGKNGLAELQSAIVNTINDLVAELLELSHIETNEVRIVTVAGNTAMTHLFLGLSPKYIRLEPYIPLAAATPAVKACELGLKINPAAYVVCFPSVASYVGGDIVSGLLVANLAKEERITLFIDIGTNGEMVLGNRDWLVTAACSAGPAFEGGGITHGMRAMKGAIDNIAIDPATFDVEVTTIGRCRAQGICGSGLINCLATLRAVGIIDRAGKLQTDLPTPRLRQGDDGWEFVLVYGCHLLLL
jgi:GTP-binding protein Era